jgi:hypothetical protein
VIRNRLYRISEFTNHYFYHQTPLVLSGIDFIYVKTLEIYLGTYQHIPE